MGVVFVGPFGYVVARNIDLGTDLVSLLFSRSTLEPLRRSLLLGGAVAASTAIIGTTLAFLTIRTDLRWRRVWRLLAPLPLVFPSFVGATALIAGFASGGLVEDLIAPFGITSLPEMRGFRGSWLVLTLFTYPYVYLPVAARMGSLPPEIEESARLLGRQPFEVFVTVVLPQVLGAVLAGAMLVFLYSISDFGAVSLLGYRTLAEQIFADQLFDQSRSMGLALVLGVCAIGAVIAERTLQRRRTKVEVVSRQKPVIVPLNRWGLPWSILVAVFIGNALLGPLAVFGFWAWRGFRARVDSVGLSVNFGDLVEPAWHTVQVSLLSAVVAMVVVLPLAWLTGRYQSRVAGIANSLVVAGFALPGVVIALSLVFWSIDAPLLSSWYQSLPLLIVAYVLHFGALASRAAQVGVEAVPVSFSDAAATLGVGRLRRFSTIELPLMVPSLFAGGGLVMLSTMKELPATLLLAPLGFDTLATEVWAAGESGALSQGALASLVLVGLSAILTWAVVLRRFDVY